MVWQQDMVGTEPCVCLAFGGKDMVGSNRVVPGHILLNLSCKISISITLRQCVRLWILVSAIKCSYKLERLILSSR